MLAQCTPSLLQLLKATEFRGIRFVICPTVHDAIIVENLFSYMQKNIGIFRKKVLLSTCYMIYMSSIYATFLMIKN